MTFDAEEDEYTPHDRGLLIRHGLAQKIARGETTIVGGTPPDVLDAMAGEPPRIPTQVSEQVMSGMAERLATSEDPDAADLFWTGFILGVRALLVELRVGTDN
jgi:hypothetical protein